jgi:predicted outer membrane protein
MKAIVSTAAACTFAAALVGSAVQMKAAQVQGVGSATTQRPTDTTIQRPTQTTAHPSATDAREFINHLTVAGMAEVQLGKMAAEKAADPAVKAFGQMMVTDHTQAHKELEQVAAQLHVQPPTQIDQKHRDLSDRLSKLQGAAFDREYITAMVQGHQEVAAQLQVRANHKQAATAGRTTPGSTGSSAGQAGSASGAATGSTGGAGEQALTQWAAKTLPTVQQHLERARTLQQRVK